jgi:ABC-type Fe3+-hydroxamate transport system substrate-binding protein
VALLTSTDQLGNTIQLNYPLRRIVSLVPSQTELLFDLGLSNEIVGVTRFCIHPADKVKGVTKIGGTKNFNFKKIADLQPDLIIGNKEENYLEGIEELRKHFPVWMSDIFTLDDSYTMMSEIARLTNREEEGRQLIADIKNNFNQLKPATGASAAYFIWRKPYMVAGNNTFINHLLHTTGIKNVFEDQTRYPEINPEQLSALKPDFIFLSSEPYSFSQKHFDEFSFFSPTSKVILVDGEMFSWYGNRLKYAPAYFEKLITEMALA